jgi:hypothetical protein
MSDQNETTSSDEQAQAGQDDLSGALGGSETEFVVSEEKKSTNTGLLLLLLLVIVAGGGVFFMYKRSSPASAGAATVEAAKANATISTFLNDGPNGMKVMQQMLKDTEKVVNQFLEYPSTNQIPLSDLKTNPFRFAPAKAASPSADAEAAKKKHEEEKLAALKIVQGLNLQSIIHSGSRKACMINNTMFLEGQQSDGFTVEQINPGAVVVRSGTYRFELKMQK